jgi:hypothetical protein
MLKSLMFLKMDLIFEVAPPFLGDVPFADETIAAPILFDLNLITIHHRPHYN